MRVSAGEPCGAFVEVPAARRGAVRQQRQSDPALRPLEGVVAASDGRGVSGSGYAWACAAVGEPLRVFRVADAGDARRWLARPYGSFCYECLAGRTRWAHAPPARPAPRSALQPLRALGPSRPLPAMAPAQLRCRQGDDLRRRGIRTCGFKPYPRAGDDLDRQRAPDEAARALDPLSRDGRLDAGVCDSARNSVDSLQAEFDVLGCLAALCKPGGAILPSGRRPRESRPWRVTRDPDMRYVEFPDDDGFSAIFRRGAWSFQRFHTLDQARALAPSRPGPLQQIARQTERRPDLAAAEAALSREFNLPWPDGDRLGLADAAVPAYQEATRRTKRSGWTRNSSRCPLPGLAT